MKIKAINNYVFQVVNNQLNTISAHDSFLNFFEKSIYKLHKNSDVYYQLDYQSRFKKDFFLKQIHFFINNNKIKLQNVVFCKIYKQLKIEVSLSETSYSGDCYFVEILEKKERKSTALRNHIYFRTFYEDDYFIDACKDYQDFKNILEEEVLKKDRKEFSEAFKESFSLNENLNILMQHPKREDLLDELFEIENEGYNEIHNKILLKYDYNLVENELFSHVFCDFKKEMYDFDQYITKLLNEKSGI